MINEKDKKLGYAILLFLLIFGATLWGALYYFYWFGHYTITVMFPQIGILAIDDAVKIRGTQVGKVSSISRENDSARVLIELWKEVPLKTDYSINERDRGLMGDREIEIILGTANERIDLSSPIRGTFIPGIAENMAKANNLKSEILDLSQLVHTIIAGENGKDPFKKKYHDIVTTVDDISRFLDETAVRLEQPLTEGIVSLRKISSDTRETTESILKTSDTGLDRISEMLLQLDSMLTTVGPVIDSVGVLAGGMLTDSTLVARAFREVSYLDTLNTALDKLSTGLDKFRRKGHININLF